MKHSNEIQFQIEFLTQNLIKMLMQDKSLSMEEAMDIVYNSETYKKIENEKSGLYYQSPIYVMDILGHEL